MLYGDEIMKYILLFVLCLSISNAAYDKVESCGDFVVFNKVKAINKRFIVTIEQKGPNVVIEYRRFPLFRNMGWVRGEYLVVNDFNVVDIVNIIYLKNRNVKHGN